MHSVLTVAGIGDPGFGGAAGKGNPIGSKALDAKSSG
jgi:hypothetical protein